jgi:hypothetical protein
MKKEKRLTEPEAGPAHHSSLEAGHGPGFYFASSWALGGGHWEAEGNEYVLDEGCLESYYGFKRKEKLRDNSD